MHGAARDIHLGNLRENQRYEGLSGDGAPEFSGARGWTDPGMEDGVEEGVDGGAKWGSQPSGQKGLLHQDMHGVRHQTDRNGHSCPGQAGP